MHTFETVLEQLDKAGLRGGCLPVSRLDDAVATVAKAYRSGGMGQEYVDRSVEELLSPAPPAWAKSVWMVAVPCSLLQYRFKTRGGEVQIILPAMYLYSRPMRLAEEAMISGHREVGAETEWAWLPVRILAAMGGMGEFGRNNMLYFPGLGSFPWLTGFYSSLDVHDSRYEIKRMPRCEHCGACVEACPSGALSRDSRLMRSDRCLNYATEYPERCGDWFDMAWQKELLGCLACQLRCPANREYKKWMEDGPTLSEAETRELVGSIQCGAVSDSLLAKLGGDDIKPYLGVMARRVAWSAGKMGTR